MIKEGKTLGQWLRYWFGVTFRVRIARFRIYWDKKKKKLFAPKKPEIDNMQLRAIDLFMALLKSRDSILNYSPESKARFIQSDFIWVTMSMVNDSYLINIIDESRANHAHSHEVYLPKEYVFDLMDEFDDELEKRFRSMETAKKSVVSEDLDKLILKIQNPKR